MPQKVLYQLYTGDEGWTVSKLRSLLSKYITALEMVGSLILPNLHQDLVTNKLSKRYKFILPETKPKGIAQTSSMVIDVSGVPNITGKVSGTPLNYDYMVFLISEGWEPKLAITLPIESELSLMKFLLEKIIILIYYCPENGIRARFIHIPIKVRMDTGRVISK